MAGIDPSPSAFIVFFAALIRLRGDDDVKHGRAQKKHTDIIRSSKARAGFQPSSMTFVKVVQATDFRDFNDHAKIGWLNRPWLIQRITKPAPEPPTPHSRAAM